MALAFKENKVYLYLLDPKIPLTDRKSLEDYKVSYKNAFLFNSNPLKTVLQNDGTVSAIKLERTSQRRPSKNIGGAFIYTLEHNLPPRYNPEGNKASEIDIDGFKGLGYDSAFVYDPELMILAIENRRLGTTLESLRQVIFANYEVPGFEFVPICYQDSYKKFLESEGVKSMRMKILSIPGKPKKIGSADSLKNIKKALDEVNGESITVQISSGRQKERFLNKFAVKDLADDILGAIGFAYEAEALELKIVDVDSGKVEPIDLITGAITTTTKIEKVRTISKFSIAEKIDQIQFFLTEKSPEIRSYANDYLRDKK